MRIPKIANDAVNTFNVQMHPVGGDDSCVCLLEPFNQDSSDV